MAEYTERFTRLLDDAAAGRASADELLPLVYDQLRQAAALQMRAESPSHTLQATALVHEAFVRLAGPRDIPWANRAHYYAAAAQAMRRILIDRARAKGARVAHAPSIALPNVEALAEADAEEILAVDRAVTRLEDEDPEAAAIVRLRFYAGLSVDQAAQALGVSPRTAARQWTYARARLHRMLTRDAEGNDDRQATPPSP
ncbi:MAG: ECF-type sigma factor [Planctomycetota bacterium]